MPKDLISYRFEYQEPTQYGEGKWVEFKRGSLDPRYFYDFQNSGDRKTFMKKLKPYFKHIRVVKTTQTFE